MYDINYKSLTHEILESSIEFFICFLCFMVGGLAFFETNKTLSIIFIVMSLTLGIIGLSTIKSTCKVKNRLKKLNKCGKLIKNIPCKVVDSDVFLYYVDIVGCKKELKLHPYLFYDLDTIRLTGFVDLVIDEYNLDNYYLGININRLSGNLPTDYYDENNVITENKISKNEILINERENLNVWRLKHEYIKSNDNKPSTIEEVRKEVREEVRVSIKKYSFENYSIIFLIFIVSFVAFIFLFILFNWLNIITFKNSYLLVIVSILLSIGVCIPFISLILNHASKTRTKKIELQNSPQKDFVYYRDCIQKYSVAALGYCINKNENIQDEMVATILKLNQEEKIKIQGKNIIVLNNKLIKSEKFVVDLFNGKKWMM